MFGAKDQKQPGAGQQVPPGSEGEVQVKPVLIIGLAQDGRPIVSGQIENKKLCLNLLADVMKVIINYEPSGIIVPPPGSKLKP